MNEAVGLAGAGLVVLLGAWRLRWLTPRGTLAALVVGAAILAGAGAAGLLVLLFFFVSASLLTSWRGAAKAATRGRRAVEGGPDDRTGRSARQVLANGGVAAGAAVLGLAGWLPGAELALLGALAAATADTWATEVGMAAERPTRRIVDWAPVPPGASGGVSAAGTMAGAAGALLCGACGAILIPGPPAGPILAGALGGPAGALVDSALGATLERRWAWVTNDVVNLGCTLAGAACGWTVARWLVGAG